MASSCPGEPPPTGGGNILSRNDGDNQRTVTGESAKQAGDPTACGTPDVSGAFVVTEARVLSNPLAHEAMGASRVRRSARPLQGGEGTEGYGRPRAGKIMGVIAHAPKSVEQFSDQDMRRMSGMPETCG